MEIRIAVEAIKQVSTFKYLGRLVEENRNFEAEIKARITVTKGNFGKMSGFLTNMSLSMQLRLRLLKSYIWSGLLYECESWTTKSDMKKKLEAVEMQITMILLRVP